MKEQHGQQTQKSQAFNLTKTLLLLSAVQFFLLLRFILNCEDSTNKILGANFPYTTLTNSNPTQQNSTTWLNDTELTGGQQTTNLRSENVEWNQQSVKPMKSLKKQKVLYFLHVHKAGGSTLCKLAQLNKVNVNKLTNCNVFLSLADKKRKNFCCGEDYKKQADFVLKTKYELVANEGYMFDTMNTEVFDYLTVLREPRTRLVSHYLFARDGFAPAGTMDNFTEWVLRQPDNYVTRVICGVKCENIPRGKLTATHLDYAKQRLNAFAYVLILENMEQSLKLLQVGRGWNQVVPQVSNSHKSADKSQIVQLSQQHSIDNLVTLDNEIYAYAKYLNSVAIETALHRQAYAALGKKCISPCCAKQCSFFL